MPSTMQTSHKSQTIKIGIYFNVERVIWLFLHRKK